MCDGVDFMVSDNRALGFMHGWEDDGFFGSAASVGVERERTGQYRASTQDLSLFMSVGKRCGLGSPLA